MQQRGQTAMMVMTYAYLMMISHHARKVNSIHSILEPPSSHYGATVASSCDWRGGSSSSSKKKKKRQVDDEEDDPFRLVAKAIQNRLSVEMEEHRPIDLEEIVDAFRDLSSSQQTFKGLDGAAHEAYQRTHSGTSDVNADALSVRGRARRSAARAGATADGLGACEFCELLDDPSILLDDDASDEHNGVLGGGDNRRQVLLNVTASTSFISLDDKTKNKNNKKNKISFVVLYEPLYHGGAGISHGGIEYDQRSVMRSSKGKTNNSRGRLIIIVGDELKQDLTTSLQILDAPPKHVRLTSGLQSGEVASVQPSLYKAAASLLEVLEPTLRQYENKTSAIHFVGRSLGGGVANLAAIMLDGNLPMPKSKKNKKGKSKQTKQKSSSSYKSKKITKGEASSDSFDEDDSTLSLNATYSGDGSNTTEIVPLCGLGKDRTSSISLGAPPCVSANVQSEYILSIMYGDDVVCRTTRDSLDRLLKRSKKALNSKGWIGGKQLNFMTDALSLTVNSLKSHAHGSEGEELRLAVPGRAYLFKPRSLGGFSSIHEVGNRLKGGREALRAHVFLQVDDILLSKSLWKHHQLDSYIHGLDRAKLKGFSEEEDGDDGEYDE